jgi:SAM-dependent methyltransferase
MQALRSLSQLTGRGPTVDSDTLFSLMSLTGLTIMGLSDASGRISGRFNPRRAAWVLLIACCAWALADVSQSQPAELSPSTQPAQPAVDPSINQRYMDADVEMWRGIFESERREIYHHRFAITDALGITPGMDIADVGAGTGFFTMMFAERTGPEGLVFAVDISPGFIEAIDTRAETAGLNNIVGVVNDTKSVRLEPDSVDLVFICDTYHHFEYPMETMKSIHRALRPGGSMVIVDFIRKPGISSAWVMGHVRAGAEVVISEVESAGFALTERRDFMRTQYYLRFKKREP